MPDITENEKLYTEREAAELLGLSVSTLQSWRSKKIHIPYRKLGRSVRYRHEDLMEFIHGNQVAVTRPIDI